MTTLHNTPWTEDALAAIARKYSTKKAFREGSPTAYMAARNAKLLDKLCDHMKPSSTSTNVEYEPSMQPPRQHENGTPSAPDSPWTEEALASIARKYSSRSEFSKSSPTAYEAARQAQLLDTICSHMPNRLKWTEEALAAEARNYSSKTEFYKHSRSAYETARRRGLLDKVCAHMEQ